MSKRKLSVLTAALAMLALVATEFIPSFAHAMQITQPSSSQIQGIGICSGTPTPESLLAYEGTNWCGSVQPQVSSLILDQGAGGGFALKLASPTDTGLLLTGLYDLDADPRVEYTLGTGLQIGNGTAAPTTVINESGEIVWGGQGADPELNRPLATFGGFSTLGSTSLSHPIASHTPFYSEAGISFEIALATAPAGCSTYPVYGIKQNGTLDTGSEITLTSGTVHYLVASGLDLDMVANEEVDIVQVTAPSGCSTYPANANFIVEFDTE